MKIREITEGTRCWKGYTKKGTKKMFGKTVPNCVKNEDVTQLKPQTSGTKYPLFSKQNIQKAYDEWATGAAIDTDIEIVGNDNKPYLIRQNTDGDSQHFEDDHWYLTDDNNNIVDTEGYPDPGDLLFSHSAEGYEPIHPDDIEENFPIPPTNDKLLQKIRDWQIRGTATGDSELFSMCHNYLMDPDKPMAGKLEVIQKIDLAMDMDSSETPTEKDVYDYIRNSGVDMPFNPLVGENLRAWFGKGKKGGAGGGGWDRYNTKGERIGKCGDSKKGEGKPKCLSKSKAASLRSSGGKAAIGKAVSKKRRNDPNKNRKGKAKNVSNTVGKK